MLHRQQAELVAMMVPAALLGNVLAIIGSGLLVRLSEKRKDLNGGGKLMKAGDDLDLMDEKAPDRPIDLSLLGAGINALLRAVRCWGNACATSRNSGPGADDNQCCLAETVETFARRNGNRRISN